MIIFNFIKMHLFISTEQKKSQGLQVWIPQLNLLAEDNQAIEEGKWLSDRVINAAQELLKSISTSIGGLQNALLAQNLQFTIERERFVHKSYMFRESLDYNST